MLTNFFLFRWHSLDNTRTAFHLWLHNGSLCMLKWALWYQSYHCDLTELFLIRDGICNIRISFTQYSQSQLIFTVPSHCILIFLGCEEMTGNGNRELHCFTYVFGVSNRNWMHCFLFLPFFVVVFFFVFVRHLVFIQKFYCFHQFFYYISFHFVRFLSYEPCEQ